MVFVLRFAPCIIFLAVLVLGESARRNDADVQQTGLAKGDELLQRGKFSDALQVFNAAIRKDAKNFMAIYKRSLAFNGLGRFSAAIADLDTTLILKPDFLSALAQRGKILASQGEFERARADLSQLKGQDELVAQLDQTERDVQAAKLALSDKRYDECIELVGNSLSFARAAPYIRELRANCALAKGDVRDAVGDLSYAAMLSPSSRVQMLLANLQFFALNEAGLKPLRKCLHYDPDDKACRERYRFFKQIQMELEQARQAVEEKDWHQVVTILTKSGTGLLERVRIENRHLQVAGTLTEKAPKNLLAECEEIACLAYSEMLNSKLAQSYCEAAYALNPDSIPALIGRAEHLIQMEEYDQAIHSLRKAQELTKGQNPKINDLLNKAQKLLKQSKEVDYYKVLDVPRDADQKTIKRAWRQASRKYHPDKVKGDVDYDAATKKFSEINLAYEVLSNPELRTRYDNGDDPNNPESNQGHDPFHQGHQGNMPFFFEGEPQFAFNGHRAHFKFHFG